MCACTCACASLAGDSDALNVKERARQLQQLLLRSEMHAPRLTGTYGRGLVIRGDPISGPVCAIGNYYTDDLSLLRSTYTHIVRVCTRGTRTRASARYARTTPRVSPRIRLSRALPLSTRSFYSPFRGFSFLLFLLLPHRPLCNFSSVDGRSGVPDTRRARFAQSIYFIEIKFHLSGENPRSPVTGYLIISIKKFLERSI